MDSTFYEKPELDFLMHYGKGHLDGGHSGRYPWGSGDDPYQRSYDWYTEVNKMKKDGKTEKDICEFFGLSSTEYRAYYSIARNEHKQNLADEARRLRDEGLSLQKIAERMGYNNDSSVRALLNEKTAERRTEAQKTAERLKKRIDEVGEIGYDHTHDISATCIQEYNGKLYMSYHTRGKGHGGCIEVFETDANKQTKLLQYLQDKDNTMDFNHLMIDSKSSTPNLYVVGNYAYHNEAGKQTEANGLMARIGINSSGLLDTDVKNIGDAFVNPLIIVPLDQTTQSSSLDENAIIRDGDKLLITSTRGYEVYDPNTLELLNSKPTPGKAKHIAINGNEIAALYYTTRPSDPDAAVDAKLDLFDAGANIATATPKKTIDIASITPNNGKNTIAIDGENIYVCRCANGLTCYDKNGTEKWTWQAPLTASTKKPQGYANGVTYDKNYVYLACGGYGLVVLDKNEMEKGKPKVVAKTRVTGVADETTGKISLNSANYVKLYNGLIYVAYGKNRLKIYQLVDKNASGAGTSNETNKKQTKK